MPGNFDVNEEHKQCCMEPANASTSLASKRPNSFCQNDYKLVPEESTLSRGMNECIYGNVCMAMYAWQRTYSYVCMAIYAGYMRMAKYACNKLYMNTVYLRM